MADFTLTILTRLLFDLQRKRKSQQGSGIHEKTSKPNFLDFYWITEGE
jgi:hypothetical protein